MSEILYSIDKAIFYFCNQTVSNRLFDFVMPRITDWNLSWYGLLFFGIIFALLLWKGGKRGRTTVILLIPLIILSDQTSSQLLKSLFVRPRPCHIIDGTPVLDNVHLLVPCGAGYSFPSSHAANNFAFAALISFFYRKWRWIVLSYAFLMGFSRISVGVHYPSDVAGGALIGVLFACIIITIWKILVKEYPSIAVENS